MMEKQRFSSMLFLLVPQIIQLMIEGSKIDEEKATELLYASELYAKLEDEKTKLWHLSAYALYEMFKEEQKTGTITYPEEA
jgi:hypothetical protein